MNTDQEARMGNSKAAGEEPFSEPEPRVDAEIIDLPLDEQRSADTMSAELSTLLEDRILNDDKVLSSLFQVTTNAEATASAEIARMSVDQFDATVFGSGGLDEKLALAELQGTLAKHGLTPLNTVEGLIKLRAALVQAYRDNNLVPAETRLKVAELSQGIQVLETKRELVIQAEFHRAEKLAGEAKLEAEIARIKAETEKQVAALADNIRLLDSGAEAELKKVQIEAKLKTAKIDRKLQDDAKRTEYIKKKLANSRELRVTIFRDVVRPAVRTALLVLIPLIMAANLIADGPGRGGTFLLGFVNDLWDAIFTPIWDGLIRSFNQVVDR